MLFKYYYFLKYYYSMDEFYILNKSVVIIISLEGYDYLYLCYILYSHIEYIHV